MAYWAAIGQIAGEVGSAWLSSDSQHKTNRMNLRLQRENQAWQRDMSNTAIQRRAADIEAAGGNRALAFTNGSEASTPTTTPARMDPVRFNSPNLGTAILAAKQAANIQKDTDIKTQEERSAKVKADLDEFTYDAKGLDQKTTHLEHQVRETIDTKLKHMERDLTAAQLDVFNKTKDAMITMAINDAKESTINVEALENYAKAHGLEAERAVGLVGAIVDTVAKGMNPFRKRGPQRGDVQRGRPTRSPYEKPDWRQRR